MPRQKDAEQKSNQEVTSGIEDREQVEISEGAIVGASVSIRKASIFSLILQGSEILPPVMPLLLVSVLLLDLTSNPSSQAL